MTQGKPEILLRGGEPLKKNKRVMVRFPRKYLAEIKTLMKEKGIKGIQNLFDYMVVSGIVLREPIILDYVEEKLPDYKQRAVEERLSRFEGKKNTEKKDIYGVNCTMYSHDKVALDNFVTDKNCKKSHLFEILMCDAFLERNEDIENFIDSLTKRNVSERKKAIARLADDKWVRTLDDATRNSLLKEFTKEYDKSTQKFHSLAAQEFLERLDKEEEEIARDDMSEDELLDLELNNKMSHLRRIRTMEANKLAEPVDDD